MKVMAGLVVATMLIGAADCPAPGANWRRFATSADRARLRDWRDTWLAALEAARPADGGAIARESLLFAPDRALPGAIPPAGAYRCRTIKLGANGTAMHGYTDYPVADCQVKHVGDAVRFVKTGGAQRIKGTLYPDSAARAVFLGTLMLGDERKPLEYGRDAQRDMAGYVERIGERRWRIGLPAPHFESKFDVIELVPAG